MTTLTYERPIWWEVINGGEAYIPFPWQERHIHVPSGKHRTIALACGRRAGKTDGLIPEVVRACFQPSQTVHGKEHHPIVYICGPTNELAHRIWTPIWNLFVPDEKGTYVPPLGDFHVEHDKNRGYIKLVNGTEIYRKSGDDPRSAQGQRVTAAFVDEAQDMNEEFWANLIPALADAPGELWCIGIARGKGRFRSYYMAGQEGDPAFYSASVPSEANPALRETAIRLGFSSVAEYLEHDFGRSMTETEKLQQFYAQWVEEDGAVFKNYERCFSGEWEEPELKNLGSEDEPRWVAARPYIMGLDVAQTMDYTVAYIGDVSRGQIVAGERSQGIDYVNQALRIANLYHKYHCLFVHMDDTGVGKAVADILRAEGLSVIGYTFSNRSKSELVNTFIAEVERGTVVLPKPDAVLFNEMKMYEVTVSGSTVKYGAPPGYHDDCLREGALIKTERGYRPIEAIVPGDRVFTHTGRLCAVTELIRKPFSGPMHSMKFGGQAPLDLSYNHPLLAAKRDYSGDLSGEFTRRDWELPGDWKRTYRAVTPLVSHSGGGEALGGRWELDASAAKFLGRFLADGNASATSPHYTMSIAFHSKERAEAEQYATYVRSLGPSVRLYQRSGKALTMEWAGKWMWALLRECYDADGEKQMPSWGYRMGIYMPDVLEGWLEGDGWRRGARSDGGRTHTIGASTSRALALEMRDIAIAAGRSATVSVRERHRYGRKNKPQWWVAVYDDWRPLGVLRRASEGEVVSPLSSHETYEYEGEVYNLEVADDHSFIAEGIAVHNCVTAAALTVFKMARNRGMGSSPVRKDYVSWNQNKPRRRVAA